MSANQMEHNYGKEQVKSIVFQFPLRLYHGLVQLDSIFTDD